MKLKTIIAIAATGCLATAAAQETRQSSSIYLTPHKQGATLVPYSINDQGKKLGIRWGLDVAWDSEQNVRKGMNHIGKDNISIMRSSFQTTNALINDTELTTAQKNRLDTRTKLINLAGNDIDIVLNEDQEAGIIPYYVSNGVADVDHWCNLINASVQWLKENYPAHKVVAISPYNEPDYSDWGQGSVASFKEIAKKLKTEYPLFTDIAITGGNTLNCDKALEWYNGLKPYVDWGNTHQLAGSFDTYANFFTTVTNDGNYPYADELHNVGEAMVGAEYGMKMGIWWGFDSRARGEFCQISNSGSRIGYAENRKAWTSASVYRDDNTNAVKAFIGSSERQANTSEFMFISKDRMVYYDGYGPTHEFTMSIPGGTGYQKGQTNAERVIDVTWGEDVQPSTINGRYRLMNRSSRYVAAVYNSNNIAMVKSSNSTSQLWDIAPANDRIGGDYSFHTFTCVADGKHINVQDYSTAAGGNVMAYQGDNSSNEQWYLKYAGDGYYYILNRESGLCLMAASSSQSNGVNVIQGLMDISTNDKKNLRLWKFVTEDANCEIIPPSAPTGLTAVASTASVRLEWNANTQSDLAGYIVLRADADGTNWNTIARKITETYFIDNTCSQGQEYVYAVKAIDLSDNISKKSKTVAATPTGERCMIANWQFENSLADNTDNALDAASLNNVAYSDEHKSGEKALYLNNNFLQLPYSIADMDEMTIALWVNWRNTSNQWQRIFDFGNGTDQYIFLTPNTGSNMRLAIKNGGDEQQVNYTSKMPANSWHHVAVTLGNGKAQIYIDGALAAESDGITIKPSDIRPVLNYVGRSQFAADPYFSGYIDDMRIYNYVLNAEEISNVMDDLTNAIDNISSDQDTESHTYYNIGGVKASANDKGVIVTKQRNGITKKIIK